jgi:hypothetical protein
MSPASALSACWSGAGSGRVRLTSHRLTLVGSIYQIALLGVRDRRKRSTRPEYGSMTLGCNIPS